MFPKHILLTIRNKHCMKRRNSQFRIFFGHGSKRAGGNFGGDRYIHNHCLDYGDDLGDIKIIREFCFKYM